jgi:hypothetical protein
LTECHSEGTNTAMGVHIAVGIARVSGSIGQTVCAAA